MSRIELKVISVAAAAGLLAACSTMPQWTKPTTWIDGVSETGKPVEKAETKPAEAVTTPVASVAGASPVVDPLEPEPATPRIKPTDKPTEFPNVNVQPAPRQVSTTESQRRDIRDSLVADRDNAQHTADELRGGTQPAAAPPAPAPAVPAEATPPKP
jgi:hypothetical protein